MDLADEMFATDATFYTCCFCLCSTHNCFYDFFFIF